jgi:beta-glucosidase
MGRHARGGRNWEGFGPDPYLAGVAMNESVSGIEAKGVQTSSKHYIGNEQETQRNPSTRDDGTVIDAISANIDDRTLHELYLWPFANAVHAGTASVMCAYSRLNQTYSCANSEILNTILKDELAFPGYVVSDWGATHSTVDFANGGLDLEMPGNVTASIPSYFGDKLLEAMQTNNVSAERLEDMATRVMTPYFRLNQDKDFPAVDPATGPTLFITQAGHNSPLPGIYTEVPAIDVRSNHARGIRELGAAGTVLLKNVNGALPLTNETSFALFGNDFPDPTIGSTFVPQRAEDFPEGYEMGTLDIGGGSGTVRHTNLVSPLEAIQNKVKSLNGRVQLLFDNNEIAAGQFSTIYPTPQVCLLFLKAFASEGADRPDLNLQWNATMAVESTAAMCRNTIVVTHGPGVVLMPWADNENVTAILAAHYPGEEIGNSITDVLWGTVEPSGRLPYSIPKDESDAGPPILVLPKNTTNSSAWTEDFVEGQMIDYRWFDKTQGKEPLYEFGFGLSYTKFEMGQSLNAQLIISPLDQYANKSLGIAPGGLVDLWTCVAVVTVEVTNSGHRAGSAVPQLYVSLPQDTTPSGTPVKVLRGFSKLHLQPGETKEVKFELMRRDLSYWDEGKKEWVIPKGSLTLSSGFSSQDLRATTKIVV